MKIVLTKLSLVEPEVDKNANKEIEGDPYLFDFLTYVSCLLSKLYKDSQITACSIPTKLTKWNMSLGYIQFKHTRTYIAHCEKHSWRCSINRVIDKETGVWKETVEGPIIEDDPMIVAKDYHKTSKTSSKFLHLMEFTLKDMTDKHMHLRATDVVRMINAGLRKMSRRKKVS